jgi:hypothetical protein
VQFEKQPHLPDADRDLGRHRAATVLEPVLEAPDRCLLGRALAPWRDAKLGCQLPGRGHQAEPACNPSHLTIGPSRAPLVDEHRPRFTNEGDTITVTPRQQLDEPAAGVTTLSVGYVTKMLSECCAIHEAVQILVDTQPGARVGGDLDDTHMLSGQRPPAALGEACSQPPLAGRQEQDAPRQAGPGRRIPAHARLSTLIAEQIG